MNIKPFFYLVLVFKGAHCLAATWNVAGSGNWEVNGNWTLPATFPNGVDEVAILGNIIPANSTVTITTSGITIGSLQFNDNNNYLLSQSGSRTLTFDVSAGNASITVNNTLGNGAHTISVPLVLNDSLNVSQNSTSTLTISGGISGTGDLIYNGPNTTSLTGASSYSGNTFINNGLLNYNVVNALPPGTTVNIGDGSGAPASSILTMNTSIGFGSAYLANINSDGRLTQGNNRLVRLSGLQGSGSVLLSPVPQGFDILDGAGNTTFSGTLIGGVPSASTDPNAGSRLSKLLSSTLTLTGNSPGYNARTFISGGSTINLQTSGALGNTGPNSATYVYNAGTLAIEGIGLSIDKFLFLNGLGAGGLGALRNISGTNTFLGTINIGWSAPSVTPADATIGVDSGTLTLTGVIQGSNGIVKVGGGTLILSNSSNTYSGGTTVNDGVLEGSVATFPGTLFTTTSPGILRFNQTINATFSNAITGTGTIEKTGVGILTLSAINSYSGATVTQGTLIGTTNSLNGPIVNHAELRFDQAFDGIFPQTISGTGTLRKLGAGTVTFSSNVTQPGGFFLDAGGAVILATLDPPSGITTAAGTTLSGTGTLQGTTDISGTLAPGINSTPATLTQIGNVTFQGTSEYAVDLTVASADFFNVAGTATILPGASLSLNPADCPIAHFQHTIIQATGGVSGTFTTVFNPCPLTTINVFYTPNSVVIRTLIEPFQTLVSKGNPGIVAAYLDKQDPAFGSDLDTIINALASAPNAQVLFNWLNQLHPAPFNAIFFIQENRSVQITKLLSDRSYNLLLDQIFDPCRTPCDAGLWIAPMLDFNGQDTVNHNQGYNATSGILNAGFDYSLSSTAFIGISFAYAFTSFKCDQHFGTGEINSFNGSLYGATYLKKIFLESVLLAGYDSGDLTRKISFSTIHRKAKHVQKGYFTTLHTGISYPMRFGSTILNPFAAIDGFFGFENSYKEKGAESLNLFVKKKQATMLRGELGLTWTPTLCLFGNHFVPSLGFSVIRDWRYKGRSTTSQMQGATGTFKVFGLNEDQTLLSPKATLAYFFDHSNQIFVRYDGEFGKHSSDQNATLEWNHCF